MPVRKQKKYNFPLLYLIFPLVFFVVLFVIFSRPKVCGYQVGDGFRISCSCLGAVRTIPDEQGNVSEEGIIDYCYGLAKSQVCFKRFDEQKPAKPYLCSGYPYEVSLLTQASRYSRPLYPDSKFSYEAQLSGGDRVVLETREEVSCSELRVQGFVERIVIGGATPTYQGFHLYAENFHCVE